jgi:hypothetical protein
MSYLLLSIKVWRYGMGLLTHHWLNRKQSSEGKSKVNNEWMICTTYIRDVYFLDEEFLRNSLSEYAMFKYIL